MEQYRDHNNKLKQIIYYEAYDYILIHKTLKNAIKNVESDVQANIISDHYPLIADIEQHLKVHRITGTKAPKVEWVKATEEDKEEYNKQLLQLIRQLQIIYRH